MMLVCNMVSSMHLGKQSRAVATNPEQSVHQTRAGKYAQVQCATSNLHVDPLQANKHAGKPEQVIHQKHALPHTRVARHYHLLVDWSVLVILAFQKLIQVHVSLPARKHNDCAMSDQPLSSESIILTQYAWILLA